MYYTYIYSKYTEFEADEMEVIGARDAEQEERDYEEYRRQLEGDKEMRKNVRACSCIDIRVYVCDVRVSWLLHDHV